MKRDKTYYQAEKNKDPPKQPGYFEYSKRLFFFRNTREKCDSEKDITGKIFCFKGRKILPESRESCILIKKK